MSSTIRKDLLSSAKKRTSEWIFSNEVQSDLTVIAGGNSFSLHKFPLVSKCGYIRKLISESGGRAADPWTIDIGELPGGADAFELAAKFCYGINFAITTENIIALRCAAEFLEMTEEYAVGNLVGRTEAYIDEVALKSLSGAVLVLHSSEDFLPIAEKVKLVSRCVDTIAFVACKDSQFAAPTRLDDVLNSHVSSTAPHWWAEDLTVLRIDLFQRVLVAMIARGFKQCALGPMLVLYAQKSLRGLDALGKARKKIEPRQEYEKRVVLETIVGLLLRQRNTVSVSFLSTLLRAAMYLETTVACRLDLEKRIAAQLGEATIDDLLIPSYSFTGDTTLFDVDTMQRIMANFIDCSETGDDTSGHDAKQDNALSSCNEIEKVAELMKGCLAEIASDVNLSVSKFITVAGLIPERSRITEDGMYRAIDIYLKAHPALSDLERKKVCGAMDCRKLSREACAHAAQNDRLPVQTVVQVLYYEQQRLREAMDGGRSGGAPEIPPAEASNLRKENQDLKVQLMEMRNKMKEMEKSLDKVLVPMVRSPPAEAAKEMPRKSFIGAVSKKLGRLIVRADTGLVLGSRPRERTRPGKDRRHSIS
ncbi:BTB/POZ domain-containing protein SR1IP1-like [Andrographis paniculata]|uniref:BTB/POZ domain-containing protein SR1IP1-like n=1 Tax=Andrographis paniculata TaxID=175694 RepID=UPI0021E86576|nr:BTB/POZ domain-containing protein SR1IP1-like [Andrographis paniculata]